MSVGRIITRNARHFGSRTAVIDGDRRLTFAELDSRVNRLANWYRAVAPVTGTRVALLLPNSLEFVEADFACAKAGHVKVPINPRLSPEERRYIVEDAGVEILVFHADFAEFVEGLVGTTPVRHFLCAGKSVGFAKDYEDVIAAASDRDPFIPVSMDDPHFLIYTSGTTGHPKGAICSNRNRITASANSLMDELEEIGPDDGMVHVAPMSHGSGSKILTYHCRGAANIPVAKFSPDRFLRVLEETGGTGTFIVPTIIKMLLDSPGREALRRTRLQHVTYGGAPISLELLCEAVEFFGPIFVQVYGTSEALHPITTLKKAEHLRPRDDKRLRSAGRCTTLATVDIVDDAGQVLPRGEVGEVVSRGDNVMLGYWQKPEATAEVLQGGHYHTGDLGYLDDEGYLFIVDRKRDLIISGGLNVYPAEVEAALRRHPAVVEAAVVGIPDPHWGEAVAAFVIARKECPATESELIEHCRGLIADYKRPRHVFFVDDLPKGSTGKYLKRQLAAPFWAGAERRVH